MTRGKGVVDVRPYRIWLVCVAVALVAGCEALPPAQLPEGNGRQLKALDQGWTPAQRAQFYHASQGSVLLPYTWLMALEQPEVKFIGSVGRFLAEDYIGRFGFLPGRPMPGHEQLPKDCTPSDDPASVDYTCGLPVGFSRAMLEPEALSMPGIVDRDVVGLTCSACHTGELHYRGNAIRIDGASAQMDPTSFQSALGGALILTQRLPFRFNRFADRVLARPQPPMDRNNPKFTQEFDAYKAELDAYERTRDAQRAALRKKLDTYLQASTSEIMTATRKGLYAKYPGGFGRTDALARITNMVFGTEMQNDDNLVVGNAPVKFPQIWDSPYFAWAQYNDSIEQSMTRNIGESLGVRAKVHYSATDKPWDGEGVARVRSTVDVPGLLGLETLLRGEPGNYFSGLRSPVWPEAYLGPIDWPRAKAGKVLYDQRCAGCHHPPLADLVEPVPGTAPHKLRPKAGTQSQYWVSNNDPSMLSNLAPGPWPEDEQQWFLRLETVDLGSVGTDPGQSTNFAKNIINTKQLLLPPFQMFASGSTRAAPKEQTQFPVRVMPAGAGLQKVTIAIANGYFDRADALIAAKGMAAFAATLPANLRQADGTPTAGLVKEGRVNRDFWNGYRPAGAIAAPQYHAPPLNGIWSSPPYLHNGSVPTIEALLSPLAERPTMFYTGRREYDVEHIGYRTDRFRGAFTFNTRVPGNANTGHRFENGPKGNGVIGSALDPGQRREVIEFLKTLCPPGRWTDYTAGQLCTPNPPASAPTLASASK